MTAAAQAVCLCANAALNLDYSRACGGGANGERGWGKRVELVAASSHESKSFRGGGDQVQPGSKSERGKHTSAWAMTAQAVGGESVLQFLDAVFALAPVLIEVEDLRGGARTVGDHVTQGAAAGAVLGFDADAARALPPALAAMPEAAVENVPLGVAQVAAVGFFRQRLAAPLKGRMVPMPKLYWISQRSQNSYSAGMAKPASPTRRMGTPGNSRCSQRTRRRNTGTQPRELPTSPRRRCAASRYPVCRSKTSRG